MYVYIYIYIYIYIYTIGIHFPHVFGENIITDVKINKQLLSQSLFPLKYLCETFCC